MFCILCFFIVSCESSPYETYSINIPRSAKPNEEFKIEITLDDAVIATINKTETECGLHTYKTSELLPDNLNEHVEEKTVSIVIADYAIESTSSTNYIDGAFQSGKYIALLDDISLPTATYFSKFSGTLEGFNHTLTIEDPPLTVKYESYSEYSLIYSATGTIKNLVYSTNGLKALVFIQGDADLTFDNVKAKGEMKSKDTNVGAFIIYPNNKTGSGVQLTFDNCSSYVNFSLEIGNYYSAPFIGAYGFEGSKIAFKNCTNYGKISAYKWASMLICNGTSWDKYKDNVTIENCINYGTITAAESVQLVVPGSTDPTDETKIKNSGKLIKLEVLDTSAFSVDKTTGTVTLDSTVYQKGTVSYRLTVSWAAYKDSTQIGTRSITIDCEDDRTTLPTVVKSDFTAENTYAIVNNEVVINPQKFDLSADEVKNLSISYYFVDIKDSDGNLISIGSQKN